MSGSNGPVSQGAEESGADRSSGPEAPAESASIAESEAPAESASIEEPTPAEESTPPGEATSADDATPVVEEQAEEAPHPIAAPSVMRRMGMWMFIRGIAGVAFGLATVFWPRETLANITQLTLGVDVADYVILAYLVLSAVLLVGQALAVRSAARTVTGSAGASGQAGASGPAPVFGQFVTGLLGQAIVVIPTGIFLLIADTPAQLRAAVCIWAVLHGSVELWLYRLARTAPMASDHLLAAFCHVLLGVIVGFGDDMGALTVFGFAGAAVLIASVLYMLGGYTRVSRARAALASAADD